MAFNLVLEDFGFTISCPSYSILPDVCKILCMTCCRILWIGIRQATKGFALKLRASFCSRNYSQPLSN